MKKKKLTSQQILKTCNDNLLNLFFWLCEELEVMLKGEVIIFDPYAAFLTLEVPDVVFEYLLEKRYVYRKLYKFLKNMEVSGENFELTVEVWSEGRRFVLSNSNIS